MIQIKEDLYRETYSKRPVPLSIRTWVFEDLEGLWRFHFYSSYRVASMKARSAYRKQFQTNFGVIQVIP